MPNWIESRALELLQKTSSLFAPVPVETIALKLGLEVEAAELGDDVSGVLVISAGRGRIGYSARDSQVRRRFTIAHEIAHYVLHSAQSDLFIDRRFVLYNRDQSSSKGEHRNEIQANKFAASLLMPADLVRKSAREHAFDLGDEAALSALAKEFAVSQQAMSIRLSALGLLPSR